MYGDGQSLPSAFACPGRSSSAASFWQFQLLLLLLACYSTLLQDLTQDSATLTGWRRTHRSWEGKMIALYGPGICSLWYWSFPAYFRNPEFSGDLQGHRSGESLAYAGTLHSSMPEDISGIFRRFPCEKMKECAPGRIKLVSWRILIFTSTTRPRLPYMMYCFSFIQVNLQ